MRVLIFGGNGFLGKHIIIEFKKHNYTICDTFSTTENKQENIIYYPSSKQVNCLDAIAVSNCVELFKPDAILAAQARCGGILANANSPADFLMENVQMGINIFEAARKNNIKRVYSLGSVCSYGSTVECPMKEDDLLKEMPHFSNAPYGIAKRTILALANAYREQYNIGGAYLIPINLFGPMDNFDLTTSHVIPALIRKIDYAIKNKLPSIECFGSGEAGREFLFAEDCAEAICKAIITNLDTPLPINLGVGKDILIKDLVKLIANLMNYDGQAIFTGNVGDGQWRRRLDVSRSEKLIGWKAKTSFKEGIMRTINWHRKNEIAEIMAEIKKPIQITKNINDAIIEINNTINNKNRVKYYDRQDIFPISRRLTQQEMYQIKISFPNYDISQNSMAAANMIEDILIFNKI